jgi:hypothetical protein
VRNGKGPIRERNCIQAVLLASIVIAGGLLAYRRLVPKPRPDPVGDYEEKPDGAIPDGRAEAER